MSYSSNKKMKFTENIPEDVVDHIMSTFLPIQDALKSRVVSKGFRHAQVRSRYLDFSNIYSKRRTQLAVVGIIEDILKKHKGLEINQFVLILNHIGIEDKILTWIKTCMCKNIQELVLDFSKSRKVIKIPIDFSAMETLRVLKLKWCKFEIPDNSPKGLKLLRTLALMKTKMTKEMVDAIFNNCIHLETLEIIKCQIYGVLSINAQNNKKFKVLILYSMPKLLKIFLDAPTLECYKYDGYVRKIDFSRVNVVKEAKLHYNRSYDWHRFNPLAMVIANMGAFTGVHVLSTTNIFLEALAEKDPTFCFWNLQEFQICFQAPTNCTLYDIAEFLKQCPALERVSIDINDFTFEPYMSWEKPTVHNGNYPLNTIKYVEIMGYKNHWHELDIVEFFVKNAKSLEKLMLIEPRNSKITLLEPEYERIANIKSISPKKGLIQFIKSGCAQA